MIEYEVVWNGGPLLPERTERLGPMWRGMLSDQEAGLLRNFMAANSTLSASIRTGRFCACGCGTEMVYAESGNKCYRNAKYRRGHFWRDRKKA